MSLSQLPDELLARICGCIQQPQDINSFALSFRRVYEILSFLKDVTLLRQALKERRLAVIVGAGVSLSATGNKVRHISWNELIHHGLHYLQQNFKSERKKRINRAIAVLHSADSNDDLPSYNFAANVLGEELYAQAKFAEWLLNAFGGLYREVCDFDTLDALKELQKEGTLIITTNYDDVLERHCSLSCISRSDKSQVRRFLCGKKDGILHIHGSYEKPDDVVLDATSYYKDSGTDFMKRVVKAILRTHTVLFIGCGEGLQDPNFDALLEWAAKRTLEGHRHYFLTQENYRRNYSPFVRLTYGTSHKGLSLFLRQLLEGTIYPTGQRLQTPNCHGYDVDSMAFSQDGKILATASSNGIVLLVNPSSGRLQTLQGHNESVIAVIFSQDGKLLASASSDKTVKLWELSSGLCLQTLQGHTEPVTVVTFSQDGKMLASASSDKTVKVWELSSALCLQTLQGHTESVTAVTFSQDGKMLASASSDETVKVWELSSALCLQTLQCRYYPVTAMDFSQNGTILASVPYGKEMQVLDPATGHICTIEKSSTYSHLLEAISVSLNGKMLASVSREQVAQLFGQPIEEGLQELRGGIKNLRDPWDILFFADLNGFWKHLDGEIGSVLTVTGSFQDAFANTASCYVGWRWGHIGIEILNWLSHLLLAAQLPWPRNSLLLRIHGEGTSASPMCIELQGQLSDRTDARDVAIQVRLVEGKVDDYKHLAVNIGSQLAWMAAAFQDCAGEGPSFSRAKITGYFPKLEQPQSDKAHCLIFRIGHNYVSDSSLTESGARCWHELFTGLNVAIGFNIPNRENGMRGVELPFFLLTTFGCVSYIVRYKGGFVLKGYKTALLPDRTVSDSVLTGKISAVQWHIFVTRKPRLYMEEVEKDMPSLRATKIDVSPIEFCDMLKRAERHFLGLSSLKPPVANFLYKRNNYAR
ncbi:uncharacterized WD repeat-containing protein alr3466 [Aspergillus udagawae]|nr:uncharacterized WD repeat-containing protein alr3466 [Aspergillus udagawae]